MQAASPQRSATGVAIIQRRTYRNFTTSADTEAVAAALKKLDPTLPVVPGTELIDALYPWLSAAALDEKALAEWLRHPAIVGRADSIGVRYIVAAKTLKTWTEEHGAVAPLGAGGIFGLMWWSRREAGDLDFIDLLATEGARPVVHQRDVPTLALPAFVVPVPIPIAPTGDSMADAIAKQLLPLIRLGP